MSSYDPNEEDKQGSSYDPGVQEKEITDQRDLSETLSTFDRADYILLGMAMGFPAGILTAYLLARLFPDYQDTASAIVRAIFDLVSTVAVHAPEAVGLLSAVG